MTHHRHAAPVPASRAAKAVLLGSGPRLKAAVTAVLMAMAVPAAAQTQADMNRQAGAAYKAADAAMTTQWQRTYAAMKVRDAADTSRGGGFGYAGATLLSQRAWLQFRDRQCVIEGGEYAGGSMQPMVQAQCLGRLTRERTAQLKDMMWQRGR